MQVPGWFRVMFKFAYPWRTRVARVVCLVIHSVGPLMHIETTAAADQLGSALTAKEVSGADIIAQNAIWLEACGYPGLKILAEALADEQRDMALVKDSLGLDLKNVSCVFLADKLCDYVIKNGRIFLRNVRHGLYLLPASVESGYGIGCPVDPSFALGGSRSKDPYGEKLEVAARDGITIDDAQWLSIIS